MAASDGAVDFISLLPPEVVLQIALALSPDDVTRCLLVCRSWCRRLEKMEPYWRVACWRIGLSEFMVDKLRPLHGSWRSLCLASRRHVQSIAEAHSATLPLSDGYPFDVRYSCQYARHGRVIGTVYQNFQPRAIVVENVRQNRLIRSHTFKLACEQQRSENRIVWGHLFESVYVCASASGRLTGYDLQTSQCTFRWQGHTMYNNELRFGCCEKCMLLVTAKLVSFHSLDEKSFWDLRVICRSRTDDASERPQWPRHCVLQLKLYHGNRDIVGRRAGYGKKKVWLLSEPGQRACSSHLLLLQWANSITGHVLSSTNKKHFLSLTPRLDCTVPCNRLDFALTSRTGLNSEFCLSADARLLGLVFEARLHVWNVWDSRKLSSSLLPVHSLGHEHFEQVRLVALGHLYSLIGLEFSTSLLVVLTQTGQVVRQCERFAVLHGHMVPPYTDVLCVVGEDWLSDIQTPLPADACTVVFWNKTNRSLEAVVLGEGASHDHSLPLPTKRKPWWKFRKQYA